MKYFLSLFLFLGFISNCLAQSAKDTALHQKDSISRRVKPQVIKKPDTSKVKQQIFKKPDTSKARQAIIRKPDTSKLNRPFIKKPDTSKLNQLLVKKPDTSKTKSLVIKKPDSSGLKQDSLKKRDTSISVKAVDNVVKPVPTVRRVTPSPRPQEGWARANTLLKTHPYFNFFGRPRYEVILTRTNSSKDGLFYLLTGIVLYFALIRLLFGKYMTNLFSVFFRVSLKQKQIREQLLQSPLPSLLLNIFFIISGGIYIAFLLQYYNFGGTDNIWYLMLNSTIALGLVYLTKYIILKITGWIFNITEATDTYAFVVFLVNKLLGILLIPFLVLLAFSAASIMSVLVTLSFSVIAIFFAYRYIISYAPVRKEIKVTQFHFLLYLCAFEIIPLLLIYKVLLTFLEKSS